MDRLIYTSLTAMRGSMARQTAIANNLANANTPGFKSDLAEAQSLWLDGQRLDTRAFASEEVLAADMVAGTVVSTGRDLDIAMSDDSMLAVQAENGEIGYTKRGDLLLSSSGLLTTGDGRPVQGTQGPITLPPADSINIDEQGNIWIVPQGGDASQPQQVDKLQIVSPAGSDVVKGLDGLFRVKGGGVLPDDPDARIVTRSLESSNVSATEALVKMIEASRSWDTQLKLLGDARDMDAATADLMSLPQ
ncbi:flagellar basal body rod protein FlgF [Sphingorhabdus contaminans]|uniref:flagellar basal body rod protein FlgF n=1 Tax=Sphingorhabdus contaminans TaxID=1343899 RepID=UPI003D26A6E2